MDVRSREVSHERHLLEYENNMLENQFLNE